MSPFPPPRLLVTYLFAADYDRTRTVRVMFSEISTPQTKARIFSFFSFAGSIAALLAPLAGGYLAQPAQHFPIFQKATIFVAYPYLLPSFFVGAVGYLAWLLCLLFLKETRPWSKGEEVDTLSSFEILRSPGVTIIFIINAWASLFGFAFTTSKQDHDEIAYSLS